MNQTPTDTPRTDAVFIYDPEGNEAELARTLERELTEARAEVEEARKDYEEALMERNKAWRKADEIEADNATRTTRDQYREREVKKLTAQIAALEQDKARLDWLQAQTMASKSGISFDYCRHVEEGQVVEKGFRFMRYFDLGERHKSIRAAIDAALNSTKPTGEAKP